MPIATSLDQLGHVSLGRCLSGFGAQTELPCEVQGSYIVKTQFCDLCVHHPLIQSLVARRIDAVKIVSNRRRYRLPRPAHMNRD